MFTGPLTESILKRAQQAGLLEVVLHDIRHYAMDRHKSADDYPFGGGAGMVMKPEVVYLAIADALSFLDEALAHPDVLIRPPGPHPLVILLSPAGEPFSQQMAEQLAREPRLVLVCGHYEGVDERVREHLVDDELSIGDYVLAGGEAAAFVVVEAVTRLVPGVMGNEASAGEESFVDGLLEAPHYTRPADYRGWVAPEVLRSGDHGRVARWRRAKSLARTLARRPDLIEARGGLTDEEAALVEEARRDE